MFKSSYLLVYNLVNVKKDIHTNCLYVANAVPTLSAQNNQKLIGHLFKNCRLSMAAPLEMYSKILCQSYTKMGRKMTCERPLFRALHTNAVLVYIVLHRRVGTRGTKGAQAPLHFCRGGLALLKL